MKNLKISLIGAILLVAGLLQAQKPIEKTLVTSVALEDIEQLILDLDGRLEVQKWDKDIATIFVGISSNVPNEKVMEALVANGRYEVEHLADKPNELILNAPNMYKTVTVNGVALEENVKYKIFVPKGIHCSHAAAKSLAGL